MDATLALAWYGVTLLLAGLALPVVGWLFPDWPDRGAALAPATALALLTVTAYWVGQFAFGPHALVVGLAVLAGSGFARFVVVTTLLVFVSVEASGVAAGDPVAVTLVAVHLVAATLVWRTSLTPKSDRSNLDAQSGTRIGVN